MRSAWRAYAHHARLRGEVIRAARIHDLLPIFPVAILNDHRDGDPTFAGANIGKKFDGVAPICMRRPRPYPLAAGELAVVIGQGGRPAGIPSRMLTRPGRAFACGSEAEGMAKRKTVGRGCRYAAQSPRAAKRCSPTARSALTATAEYPPRAGRSPRGRPRTRRTTSARHPTRHSGREARHAAEHTS